MPERPGFTPEQDEALASRNLSDAEQIKGGAKYEKGVLQPTGEQIEQIKQMQLAEQPAASPTAGPTTARRTEKARLADDPVRLEAMMRKAKRVLDRMLSIEQDKMGMPVRMRPLEVPDIQLLRDSFPELSQEDWTKFADFITRSPGGMDMPFGVKAGQSIKGLPYGKASAYEQIRDATLSDKES